VLAATWILAGATSLLALSGPVALFAWLNARRADRDRRQLEREEQAAERILELARKEFAPRDWGQHHGLIREWPPAGQASAAGGGLCRRLPG
jgi:hypothetical protein